MSGVRAITAQVTGLVQGVFFRASTEAEARRLGLTGTVQNVGEDQVHVVAQGSSDRLDALVRWLHRGPPHARVDRVDVAEVPVDPARASFRVVR